MKRYICFIERMAVALLLFAWPLAMKAEKAQAKIENTVEIEASKSDVWKLISGFKDLNRLVPTAIDSTKTFGDASSSSWVIFLKGGGQVKEEMLYINPKHMEFIYQMTETPMPLLNYLGKQQVLDLPDGKIRVRFTSYFETKPKDEQAMLEAIDGFQKTFLSNLKLIAEKEFSPTL